MNKKKSFKLSAEQKTWAQSLPERSLILFPGPTLFYLRPLKKAREGVRYKIEPCNMTPDGFHRKLFLSPGCTLRDLLTLALEHKELLTSMVGYWCDQYLDASFEPNAQLLDQAEGYDLSNFDYLEFYWQATESENELYGLNRPYLHAISKPTYDLAHLGMPGQSTSVAYTPPYGLDGLLPHTLMHLPIRVHPKLVICASVSGTSDERVIEVAAPPVHFYGLIDSFIYTMSFFGPPGALVKF